ncbi:MAG: hypothetical protein Q9160_003345 [Pyrenula sp. 1 TL-2023]
MFRTQFSRNVPSLKSAFSSAPRRSVASFSIPSRTSKLQPFRSTRLQISSRLPRRWVTTEAEAATEGDRAAAGPPAGETATEGKATPENKPEEQQHPLQKELDAKNREIIDLKDSYLRQVADFRNLQDRTKRDMESARQFAIQRFATDLIESIDNLDRGLTSVSPEFLQQQQQQQQPPSESSSETSTASKDLQNLYSGLKMSSQILMGTLKKHGLERFDPGPEGEPRKFNPALDEATFMTKAEGKEDGDVLMTQSKGFTLNGRVLRAAKVGVVKNS